MSRRVHTTPLIFPQPLEERVDKAGVRQRENPAEARQLRELGREQAEEDAPGWWHFDGMDWTYHGNRVKPGPAQ